MEQIHIYELYEVASEYPYKDNKSFTTVKEFKPSWPKKPDYEFKPLVLKQIGALTKN